MDTIRAYCNGFVFETPYTCGWQDRLRQWRRAVELPSGATLELRKMKGGVLSGQPHYSTIS